MTQSERIERKTLKIHNYHFCIEHAAHSLCKDRAQTLKCSLTCITGTSSKTANINIQIDRLQLVAHPSAALHFIKFLMANNIWNTAEDQFGGDGLFPNINCIANNKYVHTNTYQKNVYFCDCCQIESNRSNSLYVHPFQIYSLPLSSWHTMSTRTTNANGQV